MGIVPRTIDRIDNVVNRTALRSAAIAWLFGGALWFVLEAIAALAFPHYDYARFYISDLGNPLREIFDGRPIDSPLAWVMNVDFVAHGAAFFAGACFAFRAVFSGKPRSVFVALTALNFLGGCVVATFHSSSVAEANGTERIHELGAFVSIVGGDLAIAFAGASSRCLGASSTYRTASVVVGLAGLASLALLVGDAPLVRNAPGLYERGAVYPIMLWEIATALVLLRRRPIRG